ncbi:G-protein coupled receptor 83-like [Saccoglossus kowalevskii]|uniref:Probable G-protein coupled receptor 83-like n=1 Tax=Saccoglossus kowalevskii TaxID=10224 RepID=A0ABM0MT09_SACKO|nr:PREDICTED: probable G-protein coupled receptor 83-like [Saccoglossus kowalevskii]
MSLSEYNICSCVIYIAVIVGGTFGNGLVCYIVYTNRNLRTAPNFQLVALAVADLIVCTIASPLRFVVSVRRLITSSAIINDGECFWETLTTFSSIIITVIMLAGISLTRFIGITNKVTKETMKKFINLSIVISFCIGICYGTIKANLGKGGPCGIIDVPEKVIIGAKIGIGITFVSLLVSMVSNICICCITQSNHRALKRALGDGGRHGKATNIATMKLSLRLVVCFMIIYLPITIHGILVINELVERNPSFANFLFAICCAGSAVNPIIYTLTSSAYKNHLPWKK